MRKFFDETWRKFKASPTNAASNVAWIALAVTAIGIIAWIAIGALALAVPELAVFATLGRLMFAFGLPTCVCLTVVYFIGALLKPFGISYQAEEILFIIWVIVAVILGVIYQGMII